MYEVIVVKASVDVPVIRRELYNRYLMYINLLCLGENLEDYKTYHHDIIQHSLCNPRFGKQMCMMYAQDWDVLKMDLECIPEEKCNQ